MGLALDEKFPNSTLGYAISIWYTCSKCGKAYTVAEVRNRLLIGQEMRWVKERVMEYEWKDPSYTKTVHRIYNRLRSDGSMWYQLVRRDGFYDQEPAELENRFSRFLVSDVPVGARSGWSEKDFDEDFLDRLQKMNGKEITPVVQ